MNFPVTKLLKSEAETKELAKDLSNVLNAGDIITLNGELGSGKTFLVKSICENYSIRNSSSPSFAIVNVYEGDEKINHFDFYRIKKIEELYDIGIEDYFSDENAIMFIEWGELFPEILPPNRFEINIKYLDSNSREIKIEKYE